MREIKFRIWSPTTESFVYTELFAATIYSNTTLCATDFDRSNFPDKECVIQQYTGLKDKNGKEIYEGDILKLSNLYYRVVWENGGFSAECPNYNRYHWPRFEYFDRESRCSENVGNIFENPELLKK